MLARPVSTVYTARKFLQRHKAGALAVAAVLVLAASFATFESVQLRRITAERDRANHVTAFLTDMFNTSDPARARETAITVREVLDKASHQIETGLGQEPEVRAELMNVMGTVYTRLGLAAQAEALLERSAQIYKSIKGPQDPATLKVVNNLAVSKFQVGRYGEAARLDRETLASRRRVLGERNPDTAASLDNLAGDLLEQGQVAEAEKLKREALAILTAVSGPDSPETMTAASNLADLLFRQQRYQESEKLARDVLERETRVLGPDHPFRFKALGILAYSVGAQGRPAEKKRLLEEQLAGCRRVLGNSHEYTIGSMLDVAATYAQDDKNYGIAEKLDREALDNLVKNAPESERTANAKYNLPCILALTGRKQEALTMIRSAVDHGLSAQNDLAIDRDTDLTALHGDPGFKALVVYAHQRAAALSSGKR